MKRLGRMARVPEFWVFVVAIIFVVVGHVITESANFWILIAFITFSLGFGRAAWRRIKQVLDDRADKIRRELEEAQHLKEEAQALLADYERKRAAAEEEAREMVEHARAEAERQAERARTVLEETMQRHAAAAEQRIARAEDEAMREVRQLAATLAVQAARQLIQESMDESRADSMVEESIKEVRAKLH